MNKCAVSDCTNQQNSCLCCVKCAACFCDHCFLNCLEFRGNGNIGFICPRCEHEDLSDRLEPYEQAMHCLNPRLVEQPKDESEFLQFVDHKLLLEGKLIRFSVPGLRVLLGFVEYFGECFVSLDVYRVDAEELKDVIKDSNFLLGRFFKKMPYTLPKPK